MIQSSALINKLVADLHFHHYLEVHEGDLFGNGAPELPPYVESFFRSLKIDPKTSLYHGGTVIDKSDYINEYIDDVFIDYFFRTYNFKEIIFPKGFCHEQITPGGIIHPAESISLNLQNIYDRCTFVHNMWRLFSVDSKFVLCKSFPCEGFVNNISGGGTKRFSPAEERMSILVHAGLYPFDEDFELYMNKYHHGKAVVNPQFRTIEIFNFFEFIKDSKYSSGFFLGKTRFALNALGSFMEGYHQIKNSHIFGEYSIEDLLIIYCVLIDKLSLYEESFLIPLLYCIKDIEKTFLMELETFEYANIDYHILDAFIYSEDLFLRFTSRKRSKAFKFTIVNGAIEHIQLFNKDPICFVFNGNTMPLPYLYNKLNQS